ncbi:MAG: hypothetical protein HY906_26370 [Deltaproteobacteria bacterium]|nr:hypothetical protein [Deltaproteobacteria bacterium]
MRPDAVGLSVMNGAHLEVDGLEAPERPLDGGQPLVVRVPAERERLDRSNVNTWIGAT